MGASARWWLSCALALVACNEPDAKGDPAPEPAAPEAPALTPDVPPPAPERPDEVACIELVDHMEVVVAQSLGVPVKGLFTDGERRGAIEHCKKYAHPNVVSCARDTQVLPYLQSCLFFTSLPRPDVEHPSREQCQAYVDHSEEIISLLQTRTLGQAPAPSTLRQKDRDLEACLQDFTPQEVECGTTAGSQLALLSCFSPYQSAHPRWVTAEECEVYGDHMMSVIGSYLLAPYPKPTAATMALQQSGLAVYAQPQVQRFQLVNLCHTLDRELMRCHAEAKTAADLAKCVP